MMNQEKKLISTDSFAQTDDKPIRQVGVIILVCTLGVFGVWGYLAPIDGAAMAPGVVTVKSHKKTIQHLDGGIVSQLSVKEGDIVKEGDLLLTLDGTENKAQLEIARGQFITLVAQVARLEAEREGSQTVQYPSALEDSADERIVEAKKTEGQLFVARRNAHHGEMEVLTQRIGQLSAKMDGLKSQRASKQALVASYSEEAVDLKSLLAEGFADKQRLRDTERSLMLASGEVASLTSDIASAQIQVGEAKLAILQLEKKFQEEVSTKLSEAQTNLYDVNQRMLATKDKVVRIEIKAPVSGRVMGLDVHTVGGVILPGHPILDIVPQKEELIIDAKVNPLDIDRVSVGLVADVRFSAFTQALTPVIEGKVISLSADSLTEEKTGSTYYRALVELTPESLDKMSHLELVPGMPVEVLIKTGERTVFQYLTKPIHNAFARAFIED